MHFPAARCNGLSVTYMDSLERGAAAAKPDEIHVLVPGGRAKTFHAVYGPGRGRQREALLSSQEVCVVPPGQACDLSSTPRPTFTILSRARRLREEARDRWDTAQIRVPRGADRLSLHRHNLRIVFRVGPREPESSRRFPMRSRAPPRELPPQRKPVSCALTPSRGSASSVIAARLGDSIHFCDLAASAHEPLPFCRSSHNTGQAPHVYLRHSAWNSPSPPLRASSRRRVAQAGVPDPSALHRVFHANSA